MSTLTLRYVAAVIASIAFPALGVAPAATTQSGESFPSDSVVLSIIKQRVQEKRSAGIVVGMLQADGRTRIVAYGDPGTGQPPLDGNSVFEIGSISKVFTATVLAQLVKSGAISLDDPVQKFLPASVRAPTRNGKSIALGNLSEQNSGLPRMPSNFNPKDQANPYADYTAQLMYDFLSGHALTRDPGELFEYSNLGVGLLGHALALQQGKSYEQMQQDMVWKPLGMTHTAITLSPWMKQHLALGHSEDGQVAANWDFDALAGAGAIRSTAVDMLKFAEANLHPERGKLEQAMAFAQEMRGPGGPGMSIGLNWFTSKTFTGSIVWHNGGTGGYRTFLGLDPAKKVAVVVLTNSGGAGADDIGIHLLDSTIALAPKPASPKVRKAIELPSKVLQRYVGTYELAPNFTLEITVRDGALYMHPTDQATVRLWPESETDFFLKEVDAQVIFIRDAQGVVTQLILHQNGQNMPAKKQ